MYIYIYIYIYLYIYVYIAFWSVMWSRLSLENCNFVCQWKWTPNTRDIAVRARRAEWAAGADSFSNAAISQIQHLSHMPARR